MADKKNLHDGHRQRMKERFLSSGLDGFSDHEIVELLLFYALPYRDTNDLAHALVNRYGSWAQVVNANHTDLLEVPGVTPHVATLLTLVGQSVQRYYRDMMGSVQQLYNADILARHVIPWFYGEKDESVLLVSMDNKRKHLNTTRIFRGSVNSAQFNVRLAVQQALRDNATQVALAHNHPNGYAFPSTADINTTRYVSQILAPLDICLVDHIVVAEGDGLCMSLLNETRHLFDRSVRPDPAAKVAEK